MSHDPREHLLDVDLSGYEMYRNGFPHNLFNRLRDEHPVWRHPTAHTKRSPDGIDFWVVLEGTRSINAESARDWQQFSSLEGASITPTPKELEGHSVITSDPPAHTRLRKLISAGFTPRMVRQLDDLVERRASQVLDGAAVHGTCRFVDEVAFQLPMHMIADIIGIPDGDRPYVFHWNDVLTRGGDPDRGVSPESRRTRHVGASFEYRRRRSATRSDGTRSTTCGAFSRSRRSTGTTAGRLACHRSS